MPKSKRISRHIHVEASHGEAPKGFRLSFAALGGIGTIFVLVIGLWQVAARVATKSDVDSIRAIISPVLDRHEGRIRDLELAMARQFGASPTSIRPSIAPGPMRRAFLQLAQYVG